MKKYNICQDIFKIIYNIYLDNNSNIITSNWYKYIYKVKILPSIFMLEMKILYNISYLNNNTLNRLKYIYNNISINSLNIDWWNRKSYALILDLNILLQHYNYSFLPSWNEWQIYFELKYYTQKLREKIINVYE